MEKTPGDINGTPLSYLIKPAGHKSVGVEADWPEGSNAKAQISNEIHLFFDFSVLVM